MYVHKMKKYNGFILVELMSSLLIFSIFAVFTISILSSFMKGYVKESKVENEDLYVSQGMAILDRLLKEGNEIRVQNNQIKIIKDGIYYNNIVFNKYAERIVVDYYEYNSKSTSKPIIPEVKEFNVLENKNVFYVFITCKDGRRYKRCFALKSPECQDTV